MVVVVWIPAHGRPAVHGPFDNTKDAGHWARNYLPGPDEGRGHWYAVHVHTPKEV